MAIIRIAKKHGIKLLLLLILVGGPIYLIASDAKYEGYQPDQPIAFSHKIHAGDLQINCQFCHYGVEKSPTAVVPDLATCMKCHEHVAPDSQDIQYLKQSYRQGKPVAWVKVHDLPDHVRFAHKPHIARGLSCEQCHGDVAAMDKVHVAVDFNMGWCVNCHRDFTEQEKPPGNNVTVKITECGTCHY
ncbi:MAG: cytochrome c3 family protein [Spirochaetales bacterium]|nr:cytochrome c3 family protein [Spirochaetales bacterium]